MAMNNYRYKILQVLDYVYKEAMKYAEGVSHTPATIDPERIGTIVFPQALNMVEEINKSSKPFAIYHAIKNGEVNSDIIIHNEDGAIWCVLRILAKEHNEVSDKEIYGVGDNNG